MVALRIPEGHALAYCLTSSPCRTNHEALALWIQAQCLDHAIPFGRNSLRTLARVLQYKLEAIQSHELYSDPANFRARVEGRFLISCDRQARVNAD